MKEFRRLAFKGMTNELEDPADYEQSQRVEPQTMDEETRDEDRDRNKNSGNTESVAEAVDGMLVAGRVLRDPLFASAVAQHGWNDTPPERGLPPDPGMPVRIRTFASESEHSPLPSILIQLDFQGVVRGTIGHAIALGAVDDRRQ